MVAMTQPLGITAAQMPLYLAHIQGSHDFRIGVDVLKIDGTPIRSIDTTTLDGQVNLQRDSPVRRTATLTFFDPDRSMHLDADSPWEGALFADRMIRVRHTVTVPGVGTVTATPFVGPIVKVSRDGDTLAIECQDKASLAITGSKPYTVHKHMNAVAAIRAIMVNCCGEDRFVLPSGTKRQINRAYSVGWKDDASPWAICSKIAAYLNLQLFYSCDGYLTLRRRPTTAAAVIRGTALTSLVKVDHDITGVFNLVRVTGTLAAKKHTKAWKKAHPNYEYVPTKVGATAVASPKHPMAPGRLGRNGKPRYLPLVIEGAEYKWKSDATAQAGNTLQRSLPMTSGASFSMVPLFHLDTGDLLSVQTDTGGVRISLDEGSIPLGVSGDMSVGARRRVSRGRRA